MRKHASTAISFRRGTLLLLVLMLLVGDWSPGRRAEGESSAVDAFVASKLSELLSSGPGRQVRIKKLQWRLPFDLRAERVTVSDPRGVWAVAENMVFRMSGSALLGLRIEIEEIAARTFTLLRRPDGIEEAGNVERKPLALPKSLPGVTVDKFTVGMFVLEEEVLGKTGMFQIDGNYREVGESPGRALSLAVKGYGEESETAANLDVKVLGAPPQTLALDLDLHAPPNGLLASIPGMENAGGIDLSFRGEGPLDAWKGTIEGSAERTGAMRSDVCLAFREKIGLSLDGRYTPAAPVTPAKPSNAASADNETFFTLTAKIDPWETIDLEWAGLDGPGYRVQSAGGLNFTSGALTGTWRLDAEDLATAAGGTVPALSGELTATGEVAGTVDRPRGSASVRICGLKTPAARADDIRGDFAFEAHRPGSSPLTGFQLSGTGSVDGLKNPAGKPFPEPSFGWSLAADIPFSGPVSLEALQIDGTLLDAKFSGVLDPEEPAGMLSGAIDVQDLNTLAALVGERMRGGKASLDAQLFGNLQTRSATGALRGRATAPEGISDPVKSLLQPELAFSAEGKFTGGALLSLSGIEAETASFRFAGKGEWQSGADIVHGSWRLTVPELKNLGEIPGGPLAGRLLIEGTVDGPLNGLSVAASLESDSLEVGGDRFREVRAGLQAANLPAAPKGAFRMSARRENELLEASTNFTVKSGTATLSPISFKTPGNTVTGKLEIDPAKPLVVGRLDGDFSRLGSLWRPAGSPFSGSAKFSALFARGSRGQDVQLSLNGKDLKAGPGGAASFSLNANLSNLWREPAGTLNAELKAFRTADYTVDALHLEASGNGKQATFNASAGGTARKEFTLRTRGTVSLGEKAGRAQIASLDGKFGKVPLKLLQPVTIERGNGGISWRGAALSVGTGRVDASGEFAPKRFALDTDFRDLPLPLLATFGGPELNGAAGGTLRVQGLPSSPSAKWDLRVSNLRPAGDGAAEIPPAALAVNGTLENGRLSSTAELRDLFKKPVRGSISTPARFSVTPFALSIPSTGALQGRLEASADLETLAAFTQQDNHMPAGLLNVDLSLGGTPAEPDLNGTATIENGSYRNLENGTELKNIAARFVARGARLEIESFQASDGAKGKVTASGWASADPGRNFPLQIALNVSNAALIRRINASATLSGEIGLSGTIRNLETKGSLTVDAGEISIPKQMPPNLPKLEVVEVNRPETVEKSGKTGKKKSRPATLKVAGAPGTDVFAPRLDLKVIVPGRLFVRGGGLNSEWKGDLGLTGTTESPSITGTMTVVRGTINLFDRQLKVTEGTIQFYGGSPPSPFINITAEAKAEDATVRVTVSGLAKEPKIDLQSDPQLPSDEILSRLLFKRKLTDLTPVQIVKLAGALNTLTGRGGGFAPLEKAREFLGLQQLDLRDVETAKGKSTAIGIEKYLTEEIYVDVQKGIGDETGKVSVVVEVTPHVTVEGSVDLGSAQKGQQGTGLGVNWKFDY